MTQNKCTSILLFTFSLCFNISDISAQSLDNYKKADSLHLGYMFAEAISLYDSTLSQKPDSVTVIAIQDKILQCKNGISLLNFSTSSKVIASKSIPLKNFFLYFSQLKDHSWIDIPNPLVKRGEQKYYKAIYFPSSFKKLFFSAPNKYGNWNIYETSLIQETLWSEPKPILNLASSGDEIFPILSPDGKELYFASNGHYGMGGYDLYVSKWDDTLKEWGIPENLGFPYSSTGDDIFFMNTPDGKFSMLASNRNSCANDSIGIYVTEFSPAPIKTAINDIAEIKKIAKLSLPIEPKGKKREEVIENNVSEYSIIVATMRGLQAKLHVVLVKQQEERDLFKTLTNEKDKEFLQELIKEREEESNGIRISLEKAAKIVQEAEIEFLSKGIILKTEDPADYMINNPEFSEKTPEYTFHKLKLGEIRTMEIDAPAPEYNNNLTFKKESTFAKDQTLPNTLFYQIQLSTTPGKSLLKNFLGISPIFERKLSTGKYIYSAGLFNNYADARIALRKVARSGFEKALLVSYNNGESIPLKDARSLESELAESMTYQVLLKNYPDGLSSPIIAAIKGSCDQEIAKTYHDGEITYTVGPFKKESDAEYVIQILTGLGIKGISIESINS